MRKPTLAKHARVAPMPLLPVFQNIKGKRVLLAGDDEGACWKAELLHAAGAFIDVYAPKPSSSLDEFADMQTGVQLFKRSWQAQDFQGAVLAVGSFEDEGEAAHFAEAARAAGVAVNIVDRPDYCDFQFGSIVNRSPVLVSISTDGAAPALGQAIRQRIESILPAGIADWAGAAARLRPWLEEKIAAPKQRLSFWRRFGEAAFSKTSAHIDDVIADLMESKAACGKVTLVGAGPGAEDLLTIRAVRALQSADIILFDDLVSDQVLDFARREARRIAVGKRGGRSSCKQDDINALMLRLAKQGKQVVRLKSGDPMIFGRAGEEIEYLEKAGVTVDIVPGVTTALAAASALKTSLTHRDCAQGVKFITAHSKKGELPDLDWRACADQDTTLMIYMGARTAPLLAEKLMKEGMDPSTSVVVLSAVSRPEQEIHTTSLLQLRENNIDRSLPVLIGIGAAFAKAIKSDEKSGDYFVNRMAAQG